MECCTCSIDHCIVPGVLCRAVTYVLVLYSTNVRVLVLVDRTNPAATCYDVAVCGDECLNLLPYFTLVLYNSYISLFGSSVTRFGTDTSVNSLVHLHKFLRYNDEPRRR
jgi:hypothetical protein